jgi:hypothetical protein
MTKPTSSQGAPNPQFDDASPETDNPSDCCDFGYVLVQARLKMNGAGEAHPKPKSDGDRQYDPAEQWGKA